MERLSPHHFYNKQNTSSESGFSSKIFDEKELANITAETTFSSALNITTPPFKIYNHDIAEVIENDKQTHFDFKKMIKISKENKMMLLSLAAFLHIST